MTADEISAIRTRATKVLAGEEKFARPDRELCQQAADTLAVLDELCECGKAFAAAERRAKDAEEIAGVARRQRASVGGN